MEQLDLSKYTKRGTLRKRTKSGEINQAGRKNGTTTKGKTVNFRLSLDIEKYAYYTISQQGVTMSEYLNNLIREDMKNKLYESIK